MDSLAATQAEMIPTAILEVLPEDPFDLINISRCIAARAIELRAKALESQAESLKANAGERQSSVSALETKVAELEAKLKESSSSLQQSQDEQAKLANEKTALVAMVKKLNRDVAKLETFKRTLMMQLQDENDDEPSSAVGGEAAPSKKLVEAATNASNAKNAKAETGSDGEGQPSKGEGSDVEGPSGAGSALRMAQVARNTSPSSSVSVAAQAAAVMEGAAQGASSMPRASTDAPGGLTSDDSEAEGGTRISRQARTPVRTPLMTPSIFSPQYTPTATPPHSSSAASPRRPEGKPPRVDGKEFFRQARNRLSYEQFSAFLANIKELNAHRQTREETLRKANEIFGADNKDLYTSFDGLLSRHLPS